MKWINWLCGFLIVQSITIQQVNSQTLYVRNEEEAHEFALRELKQFTNSTDFSLILQFQNHSKHSRHYRFNIRYHKLEVTNQFIQLNTFTNGKLLSIDKRINGIADLTSFNLLSAFQAWSVVHPEKLLQAYPEFYTHLKSSYLKIDIDHGYPKLVLQAYAWSKTFDQSLMLDVDGQKIEQINYERSFTDTSISVKVFHPDPLTNLNVDYGGIYVDSNDIHQNWMNAVYQNKMIKARFDNGVFYPENEWVKIDDFEGPAIAPVTTSTPAFNFNRNESGFEDGNILYHITNFHDYIAGLGYDSLLWNGVLVDAHAQNGADNSVFSRNGGNPTIRYGIGGVDDGEDADVIIHEYCHGISWSANNNDNFTQERFGLDEGIADYFATSYSRSISSQQSNRVFNWDGHNEFWSGRDANTSNNYPTSGGIYAMGEIWNAACFNIWTDLGGIITDKLMLETLYFFTNQTTLPQAAYYMLQADTVLFGGQHSTTICQRFQQKNILDATCNPVGLPQHITYAPTPILFNSHGFAFENEMAYVKLNEAESGKYLIYNTLGQVVQQKQFTNEQVITLSPHALPKGLYQVVLMHNQQKHVYKLPKAN